MITADLFASLPELWLACGGMALLMVGVFQRRNAAATVMILSVVAIAVALALLDAVRVTGPVRYETLL